MQKRLDRLRQACRLRPAGKAVVQFRDGYGRNDNFARRKAGGADIKAVLVTTDGVTGNVGIQHVAHCYSFQPSKTPRASTGTSWRCS